MKVTTFEGIVENGQVRLPADVHLPEKAKVYVVVPDMEARQIAYIASPRLAHPEQAKDFQMQVIKETTDAGV